MFANVIARQRVGAKQFVAWVEPTGRANARPMINSAIPITQNAIDGYRFRLPPSLCELRRTQSLLAMTVMLRESGVSSTPRLLGPVTDPSEYRIARRSLSSGGHSADPLAGDDG
jgi:hypothetical protein